MAVPPAAALAQGVPHSRLRVADEITRPDLAGQALFYRSPGPRGDDLKALDLSTGARQLLFDTGSPDSSIESVRAVPGRVAIGVRSRTGRDGLATAIVTFAADAPGPKFVTASGFTMSDGNGGAGCGGVVTLEDLAPDGTVVTEEAVDPCGRAPATASVIRGYAPGGESADLWRLGTVNAPLLLEDRKRVTLAGGRLLIWSVRSARLVDLLSRAGRVALPSARGTVLYQVDATAGGRLVAAELSITRPQTEARVRSVPRGSPRRGAVLARSATRLPDARFCGERLVVWSVRPDGRQRVTVRRPGLRTVEYRGPARVPAGKIRGFACDPETYAVATDTGRRRATVDLFRLP